MGMTHFQNTFMHASRVALSLGDKKIYSFWKVQSWPILFLSRVFSLLRVKLGLKIKFEVLPAQCILYGSEKNSDCFPLRQELIEFFFLSTE